MRTQRHFACVHSQWWCDRKGIRPVKRWVSVCWLVVTIWLELCNDLQLQFQLSPLTTSIILSSSKNPKCRHSGTGLSGSSWKVAVKRVLLLLWCCLIAAKLPATNKWCWRWRIISVAENKQLMVLDTKVLDTTATWLKTQLWFDSRSTALRPFNDLRHDQAAALMPK